MPQDPQNPEPEQLPTAPRGSAPSHAVQLRGNHALGMPIPSMAAAQEEDDDDGNPIDRIEGNKKTPASYEDIG